MATHVTRRFLAVLAIVSAMPAVQAQSSVPSSIQGMTPPPANMPVLDNAASNLKEICSVHPEQCAQVKQKMQADCSANPAQCQATGQRIQQAETNIQAKCQADPTQCQQVRQNMERRQARRETWRKRRNPGASPAAGGP